jgi:hypothetical protein
MPTALVIDIKSHVAVAPFWPWRREGTELRSSTASDVSPRRTSSVSDFAPQTLARDDKQVRRVVPPSLLQFAQSSTRRIARGVSNSATGAPRCPGRTTRALSRGQERPSGRLPAGAQVREGNARGSVARVARSCRCAWITPRQASTSCESLDMSESARFVPGGNWGIAPVAAIMPNARFGGGWRGRGGALAVVPLATGSVDDVNGPSTPPTCAADRRQLMIAP